MTYSPDENLEILELEKPCTPQEKRLQGKRQANAGDGFPLTGCDNKEIRNRHKTQENKEIRNRHKTQGNKRIKHIKRQNRREPPRGKLPAHLSCVPLARVPVPRLFLSCVPLQTLYLSIFSLYIHNIHNNNTDRRNRRKRRNKGIETVE